MTTEAILIILSFTTTALLILLIVAVSLLEREKKAHKVTDKAYGVLSGQYREDLLSQIVKDHDLNMKLYRKQVAIENAIMYLELYERSKECLIESFKMKPEDCIDIISNLLKQERVS